MKFKEPKPNENKKENYENELSNFLENVLVLVKNEHKDKEEIKFIDYYWEGIKKVAVKYGLELYNQAFNENKKYFQKTLKSKDFINNCKITLEQIFDYDFKDWKENTLNEEEHKMNMFHHGKNLANDIFRETFKN